MGASSSIYNNKIYKPLKCGCIYSYKDDIELPYCCYECLETIRSKKPNKILEYLSNEVLENNLNDLLILHGWKNTEESILYAKENNILLDEFIKNNDILKMF